MSAVAATHAASLPGLHAGPARRLRAPLVTAGPTLRLADVTDRCGLPVALTLARGSSARASNRPGCAPRRSAGCRAFWLMAAHDRCAAASARLPARCQMTGRSVVLPAAARDLQRADAVAQLGAARRATSRAPGRTAARRGTRRRSRSGRPPRWPPRPARACTRPCTQRSQPSAPSVTITPCRCERDSDSSVVPGALAQHACLRSR